MLYQLSYTRVRTQFYPRKISSTSASRQAERNDGRRRERVWGDRTEDRRRSRHDVSENSGEGRDLRAAPLAPVVTC